jgi:26S proteasome regulatory subunit N10
MFNCSPIEEDEKNLVKLAKKMKKSAISIDIVAFGELSDDTTKKLQAFSDNVQSAEGSYLATIPPSANLLEETVHLARVEQVVREAKEVLQAATISSSA